jgi:DDE superfamily endonuclease
LCDRGYQGLQKSHANSLTPKKKPPRKTLIDAERQAIHELASRRIVGEHVIGKLKVFRVLMDRQILPAAHFAGRCRISARACNRFESTALLVVRALSFSERAKLWSFASSLRFSCELSAL